MNKYWAFIGESLKRFLRLLTLRLIPVCAILIVAWYAFLKLIGSLPIPTTPALIMVWASVILLIFAFFPAVFDRIKKLELKDFEIELQEAVAESTPEDFLSVSDLENEYSF